MREYEFLVDRDISIKDFLKLKGVSQEIIKKVKQDGITVNGKISTNINDGVVVNDKIKIILPPDKINPFVIPQKGEIQVLFEDEYFIAVNKPKGVVTHSSKGTKATSLEALVMGYFLPEKFTFRAVNRLDRDTSGIVLIAKDELSASFLSQLLRKGEVKKTYLAIVTGEVKEDCFIIEKPIRREAEGSMKRIVSSDGKYAKSECRVIEKLDNGLVKLEVILHTGRTHQIRVHLSSVGLPLYADALYGKAIEGQSYTLIANGLQFIHPLTKKTINITI